MYIDELETYLDKIEKGSPCLINIVVVILLHAYNVYLLSNQEQAYKVFRTNYMSFALFLALKSIYLRPHHEFWPQQKETKLRGILPRQGPN